MQDILVVAYDGTASAEQAFQIAPDLAARRRALHVIAVASAIDVETHVMHDKLRIQCAAWLEPLTGRGAAAGVRVEVEVAEGVPPWVIADAARRVGAGLIVMGHRRRSLLRRSMEWSVAKRVMDRAPCPVLVARGRPAPARGD